MNWRWPHGWLSRQSEMPVAHEKCQVAKHDAIKITKGQESGGTKIKDRKTTYSVVQ
jgi:hypothetical protein